MPNNKYQVNVVSEYVTDVIWYTVQHFCKKMHGDFVVSTLLVWTALRMRKTAVDWKVAVDIGTGRGYDHISAECAEVPCL